MEALHCGLRVQDELQNIAVNFFLFNGQKINIFVRWLLFSINNR